MLFKKLISSLLEDDYNIGTIVPRQLKPLPTNQIQSWVNHLEELIIFELSEGQFYTYLKSEIILPRKTGLFARPGVNPFTVNEIIKAIIESKLKWKSIQQKITKQFKTGMVPWLW